MRFSFNFKSEDILIYSIVTFALLYPLAVALIIWYEDRQKENLYRELLSPLAQVILGKQDCKKIYQMKDILDDSVDLRDIEHMCQRNKSVQIERERVEFHSSKDIDKIAYVVVFHRDKGRYELSIRAVSDGESVKVVSVNLKP